MRTSTLHPCLHAPMVAQAKEPIASVMHVGHTGTPDDAMRIFEFLEWLIHNGYQVPTRTETMDLRKGRDFLAETQTYDAVVLHYLFRGGFGSLPNARRQEQLGISPLTSWSAWRKRLVSTQAKVIFAFGGRAEVGGTFLCDLPGYRIHKVRTEDIRDFGKPTRTDKDGLWVFERQA